MSYSLKDIGTARYFLGLEIARSSSGLFMAQNKYVMDIIWDTSLCHAKSAATPLPRGLKLMVALHVVGYLKGCPSKGLFFPSRNSLALRAYCNADWATCPDSKRSLTGLCVFLGDALVSWKTKKQSTVYRSTAEAEYCSLAATVCELRWLSYILHDLSVSVILLIDLFCDNKAAVHILANPVFHESTKHIELDCHLVPDAYKEGFISPSFVPSSLQLSDVFTKSHLWGADDVLQQPATQLQQSQQSHSANIEGSIEDDEDVELIDAG
ncbi:UNVERIFIED_CONTAM: Retrovirus-related Pol polyprotein from transposon RE1 [Sesamum indicum]